MSDLFAQGGREFLEDVGLDDHPGSLHLDDDWQKWHLDVFEGAASVVAVEFAIEVSPESIGEVGVGRGVGTGQLDVDLGHGYLISSSADEVGDGCHLGSEEF